MPPKKTKKATKAVKKAPRQKHKQKQNVTRKVVVRVVSGSGGPGGGGAVQLMQQAPMLADMEARSLMAERMNHDSRHPPPPPGPPPPGPPEPPPPKPPKLPAASSKPPKPPPPPAPGARPSISLARGDARSKQLAELKLKLSARRLSRGIPTNAPAAPPPARDQSINEPPAMMEMDPILNHRDTQTDPPPESMVMDKITSEMGTQDDRWSTTNAGTQTESSPRWSPRWSRSRSSSPRPPSVSEGSAVSRSHSPPLAQPRQSLM